MRPPRQPRQRRSDWLSALAALAAVVTALGAWLVWPGEPSPSHPEAIEAPRRVEVAAPAPAFEPAPMAARPGVSAAPPGRAAPAPAPEDDSEGLDAARLAAIQSNARLRERARQQELAAQADARWHEAVDDDGYTADDFDPAVRSLFRNITLEPRYAEGGRIEGLVIQDMVEEHPLAQVGFRRGDRIDRIQGVPLRDPAILPSLLAHLGPHFEVCVDRDGAPLCKDVALD